MCLLCITIRLLIYKCCCILVYLSASLTKHTEHTQSQIALYTYCIMLSAVAGISAARRGECDLHSVRILFTETLRVHFYRLLSHYIMLSALCVYFLRRVFVRQYFFCYSCVSHRRKVWQTRRHLLDCIFFCWCIDVVVSALMRMEQNNLCCF